VNATELLDELRLPLISKVDVEAERNVRGEIDGPETSSSRGAKGAYIHTLSSSRQPAHTSRRGVDKKPVSPSERKRILTSRLLQAFFGSFVVAPVVVVSIFCIQRRRKYVFRFF
jgi:hypothetical protein